MAYLGRKIWLFLTEGGRPGAVYSVSGRSRASREREAVYYPEERRVAIEPLDKSQKADSLRNYNAMRFNDELLVVSNGLHTEDIFNSPNRGESLRTILNKWGPEPDSLHTPRIAGIVDDKLCYKSSFYLAMVTQGKEAVFVEIEPEVGTAYGISTYSGNGTEPEPFEIDELIKRQLPELTIEGKSPEDIARFFVDKVIDPEFFVCCSTALWDDDWWEWKIAILNKSG